MPTAFRVCLLGFPVAEQALLRDTFSRVRREPFYEADTPLETCDFVLADADQADALASVVRVGLVDRAVYVGSDVPPDTPGWLPRPLDTDRVLRELNQLVLQHAAQALQRPELRDLPPVPSPLAGRAPSSAVPAAVPRSAPTRAPAPAVPSPPPAPPAPPPPPPKRVLVVDPHPLAAEELHARLQALGVQTVPAEHSSEAIALLLQSPFDAVFTEVDLGPESLLDGLALCRQLKRQPLGAGPAAPVVILSVQPAEVDRARGNLAGCDAYLGKPLDEEALLRTLQHLGLVALPRRAGRR
jgi:CheY-like chemotaxis protein